MKKTLHNVLLGIVIMLGLLVAGTAVVADDCNCCDGGNDSGLGCDDAVCEALVCDTNPLCCISVWTSSCDALAQSICVCCVECDDFDGDGACVEGDCDDDNAQCALDCVEDHDADGEVTCDDNCPGRANGDQFDTDGDLVGDPCDSCPLTDQFGAPEANLEESIVGFGGGPGQFRFPWDVAVDDAGKIYVVDRDNQRVQVFDESLVYLFEFTFPDFETPLGIDVGDDGKIYVADSLARRIFVFDAAGSHLMTVGDPWFWFYRDVAVDSSGRIYGVHGQGRVLVWNADGDYLYEWGSVGSDPGQLDAPTGIDVDHMGKVYVSQRGSSRDRVTVFNDQGGFLLQVGASGNGYGFFKDPDNVTVDDQLNIWVADTGNQLIQVFDPSGQFLFQFGRPGWGEEELANPRGIAVDGAGNAHVVNSASRRVQVFSTIGVNGCPPFVPAMSVWGAVLLIALLAVSAAVARRKMRRPQA